MDRNNALLAKWLRRFPLKEDALWHKVISAIYDILPNGWDPGDSKDRMCLKDRFPGLAAASKTEVLAWFVAILEHSE